MRSMIRRACWASTRLLKGPLHLGLRDGVEGDPLGMEGIDAQHLGQVPGDGLPLSVEVGGEPDLAGPLGELPQLRDRLRLVGGDLVGGGEVVFHVDARHSFLRALRGLG